MKKTKKYTKRLWIVSATIATILLAYTIGITQVKKAIPNSNETAANVTDTAITDTDSVEVIGVPLDDDPWKELDKIVNAYYSKTGITYKGVLKVIDDNQDTEKILEENPFEYSILGKNFHYKIGGVECISNENSLLVIDHNGKTIAWSNGLVYSKNNSNKLFDIKAFKELMLKSNAHARVNQLDTEKILTIDNITDPTIQGYRIYYNPQTYRVTHMLIGMLRLSPLNEEQEETAGTAESAAAEAGEEGLTEYYYYLDVYFSSVETLSLKPKDFHPENQFIKIINGKIEPAPAFSDYSILDAGD